MSHSILALPGTPSFLPQNLDPGSIHWVPQGVEEEVNAIRQSLHQYKPAPNLILGGPTTSALFWLIAADIYPQAGRWCYLQDANNHSNGDDWLKSGPNTEAGKQNATSSAKENLPSQQAELPTPVAQHTAPATHINTKQQPSSETASKPAPQQTNQIEKNQYKQSDIASLTDSQLIVQSFLLNVWGDSPEHQNQLRLIEKEARDRASRNPGLFHTIARAKRNGVQARELWQEAETKLDKEGETTEFHQWLEKKLRGCHEKIGQHIEIMMKKRREWQDKKRQYIKQPHHCHLPAIKIPPHGLHPNALRGLKPANQWEILIDETGTQFDKSDEGLFISDNALGRVVALAIPKGCQLPPTTEGFHATTENPQEIDKLFSTLLHQPVGIFGFTIKDRASIGHYWLSHINQLIRWVMLQLPCTPGKPLRVTCKIEQRGTWHSQRDLTALTELLHSELFELDQVRYRDLNLQITLINKGDDRRNGYVDAIAFTWGSPSRSAAERLKQSKLLGHCLLRPSDDLMERLYLTINQQVSLSATDWYQLCAASRDEPVTGLLHHHLQQLATQCHDSVGRWSYYLDEVHNQLASKKYRLPEVAAALEWLQSCAPDSATLPLCLQLFLAREQMALANHTGKIELALYQHVLTLAEKLYEEDANMACQAILRLTSMGTNYFDFQTIQSELTQWLEKPVAAIGLLNRGKLLSAQGQLCAFRGEASAALVWFDKAQAEFNRLSDRKLAEREQQQTENYRLITLMDSEPASKWLPALQHYLQHLTHKSEWTAIARSLAHSGQNMRFAHHLFLRACLYVPSELQEAWSCYLESSAQWQDGEDHPWPLILTYRAWLLCNMNQQPQARLLLQQAIDTCSHADNGVTLNWMAKVLQQLGLSLGLTSELADKTPLDEQLPAAPHRYLADWNANKAREQHNHQARINLLQQCLPFNFH